MTDGIHATVYAMQATGADTSQNSVIAESCSPQLVNRGNAMLLAGDLRDCKIDWGAFFRHMPNKAPQGDSLRVNA